MDRGRARDILKAVAGILVVIIGFYLSWNGGYFGLRLLEKHFSWSLTPYTSQLLTMVLQFVILFLLAGTSALIGRLRGTNGPFIFRLLPPCGKSPKGISRWRSKTAGATVSSGA